MDYANDGTIELLDLTFFSFVCGVYGACELKAGVRDSLGNRFRLGVACDGYLACGKVDNNGFDAFNGCQSFSTEALQWLHDIPLT